MSVTVLVPETFQPFTGGVEAVEVEGATVGQSLEETLKKFPELRRVWFKEKDKLVGYLLILLNGEKIHGDVLSQTVKDGDEIYPLPVIGGG